MEASDPQGGPAFPPTLSGTPGMTLMDYLAGAAMNGIMANRTDWSPVDVAEKSYSIAQALLNELKKHQPKQT